MKVKVLLFGRLISVAGGESIELTAESRECRVGDIKRIVFERFPKIRKETFCVAVNNEICGDDSAVRDGDEIAFLPPISGGAFSYLTDEEITSDFVKGISDTKDSGCGSVLIFEGKVRGDEGGSAGTHKKCVEEIEYSAYEKMAEAEIEKIVNLAKEKFGVKDVFVKHRTGRVKVGEIAFFVAVFSFHRKEGIGAIDFVIDKVKNKVPIWKKEVYSDGIEEWQEGAPIG